MTIITTGEKLIERRRKKSILWCYTQNIMKRGLTRYKIMLNGSFVLGNLLKVKDNFSLGCCYPNVSNALETFEYLFFSHLPPGQIYYFIEQDTFISPF